MQVNGYNSSYQVNNTNNLQVQKQNEALNMQDFLNLLVAQMTNQDAMNPMDNTEFISQMAQFSSLQAMSDLTEIAMQGQATSLIGKNVVVADYDNMGQMIVQEGIVQKVTIFGGKTKLYVNDVEYEYSNVMEIKEPEKQVEEDPLLKMLGDISEGVNKLNNSYINSNISAEDIMTTEEIQP